MFAKAVADYYKAKLVVVKSREDKSMVNIGGPKSVEEQVMIFKSNFEGSWPVVASKKKQKGIVVDCNASGGSQLREVAKEINENIEILSATKNRLNLEKITSVFVLFRVDTEHEDTDRMFSDSGLDIFRFFDLMECDKKCLYRIKEKHPADNEISVYSPAVKKSLDSIQESLQSSGRLYWDNNKDATNATRKRRKHSK